MISPCMGLFYTLILLGAISMILYYFHRLIILYLAIIIKKVTHND